MARRDLRGMRTVVTGASSGIGLALAMELARAGARQVISARREDRLQTLAESIRALRGEVEIVAGDITDPPVQQKIVDTARTALGGLDALINNAGVGAMGRFSEADPDRIRRVMEVNFFALAEMTRRAWPLLRQGNRPIVVNVSSIVGHRGVPFMAEYCASKFAVRGFSESLRAEAARDGIDVLVVSPGTTQTEFFDSAIEKAGQANWPEHRAVSAEYVAQQTVRAMRAGRHEIIPYGWGKVLCLMNRLAPRLMDQVMARYAK